MPDHNILLFFAFFFIAFVYASVGFGGGSSYLALLAFIGLSVTVIRPTALLCNIIVVSGGCYVFYKQGLLNFKKSLPLVISSVPAAFIGGYLSLKQDVFFIVLGTSLLIASLLLWFQERWQSETDASKNTSAFASSGIGGALGLLSGMVSIGGGIFLAPVLNLIKWDQPKSIAATSSFFILVNSISGLAGFFTANNFQTDWSFTLPLMAAVFFGGQLGSRTGAIKFSQITVRKVTAVLILIAAVRLLKEYY
ncbi:MAG TPA: sulfite exporter TauE/SafE family protein [Cyclobacteriaceae bacterium]|nr:sulfite exporter TauE/SafE family protein [Cyclobacteriaceae bacterium]